MQTKLLILWLLSERPLHGYRIKRALDDTSLRFWFSLNPGSIYSVLATLVRQGFVIEEAVEKEGRRPERTSYRILPEGRQELQRLLRETWVDIPRLSDPFNVALAAIPELDPLEISKLAMDRRVELIDRISVVEKVALSAPTMELVHRQKALLSAELEWLDGFIERSQTP